MPVVYRCAGCGFVLRVHCGRGPPPSPSELARYWAGRCPACGRRLSGPSAVRAEPLRGRRAPCDEQVEVRVALEAGLLEALDELAARLGATRQALLRAAVVAYLLRGRANR